MCKLWSSNKHAHLFFLLHPLQVAASPKRLGWVQTAQGCAVVFTTGQPKVRVLLCKSHWDQLPQQGFFSEKNEIPNLFHFMFFPVFRTFVGVKGHLANEST